MLSPVLKKNGYTPVRADQMAKVGLITSQIINAIIDSPLVVADLTGSNPNVFYELAIRHAIRKPYIQLIHKGDKIPFDIGAVRTIEFDITDLDSVEKAKTQIERQLREFKKGHKADSPVSVASTAAILQDNSELAEEIAHRISSMDIGGDHYYEGGYDSEEISRILRKVSCLRDYGRLDFEDLDKKLDLILSKLDESNKAVESERHSSARAAMSFASLQALDCQTRCTRDPGTVMVCPLFFGRCYDFALLFNEIHVHR